MSTMRISAELEHVIGKEQWIDNLVDTFQESSQKKARDLLKGIWNFSYQQIPQRQEIARQLTKDDRDNDEVCLAMLDTQFTLLEEQMINSERYYIEHKSNWIEKVIVLFDKSEQIYDVTREKEIKRQADYGIFSPFASSIGTTLMLSLSSSPTVIFLTMVASQHLMGKLIVKEAIIDEPPIPALLQDIEKRLAEGEKSLYLTILDEEIAKLTREKPKNLLTSPLLLKMLNGLGAVAGMYLTPTIAQAFEATGASSFDEGDRLLKLRNLCVAVGAISTNIVTTQVIYRLYSFFKTPAENKAMSSPAAEEKPAASLAPTKKGM
jgi:hypothetical protein